MYLSRQSQPSLSERPSQASRRLFQLELSHFRSLAWMDPPAVVQAYRDVASTAEEPISTLASPSFLASLRPPPLPLWALGPVSTAVGATTWSVAGAKAAANTGFTVARAATGYAFQAARAVFGPVGSAADSLLGLSAPGTASSGSGPISSGSKAAIGAMETLALGGITVGAGVTKAFLGGAGTISSSLNRVYGNDEALRCLAAFAQLVRREWTTSLPTDPYQELGLSRFSIFAVTKAASTYAALQSVTAEFDGAAIGPELAEVDIATWGKEREETEENDVFWEVTDEELLRSGEEVIQATIAGPDERRDGSAEVSSLMFLLYLPTH